MLLARCIPGAGRHQPCLCGSASAVKHHPLWRPSVEESAVTPTGRRRMLTPKRPCGNLHCRAWALLKKLLVPVTHEDATEVVLVGPHGACWRRCCSPLVSPAHVLRWLAMSTSCPSAHSLASAGATGLPWSLIHRALHHGERRGLTVPATLALLCCTSRWAEAPYPALRERKLARGDEDTIQAHEGCSQHACWELRAPLVALLP